jgi:hypothetical protein
MGSTGYSWGSTSQWSQLPTTPAANNSQPSSQNVNSNQTFTNTPEPRRDMVVRLYKEILGREADNAGLNYYLANYQISEAEIARDMYQSTEHQEVLTAAKDVREMIQKVADYEHKSGELELRLQNAESLANNYKILLEQKAQVINELKYTAETHETTEHPQGLHDDTYIKPYNDNVEGVVLPDPFAEDYDKPRKGCLGMIKGLFKFN